jgi:hypothetical protein
MVTATHGEGFRGGRYRDRMPGIGMMSLKA